MGSCLKPKLNYYLILQLQCKSSTYFYFCDYCTKHQKLTLAPTGKISIYLASNRGSYENNEVIVHDFECLKFIGTPQKTFNSVENFSPADLQSFINQHPDCHILGFISYDAGFRWIENKNPSHKNIGHFPTCWLCAVKDPIIEHEPVEYISENLLPEKTILKPLISKQEYIHQVYQLKRHIQQGDIYEVNYCIPFIAENISVNPIEIFQQLNKIAPMPFSALIDTETFSIISASPERFIKKKGNKLSIQPMKGTRSRIKGQEDEDKMKLQNDNKERSENVMIVDLTRNDLSKLAKKGTVHVDELFGVYTYPGVLQMTSTISARIDPKEKFGNILQATFPMGSMTGAPKKRAMQLIDQYEAFARGPYSGMLGYITPNNDFDFSVLIRSVFYDKASKKLFVAVGSAITSESIVEKEYEECLIKLQPLLKALNATIE